jgi:hypothetical protein
MSAGQKTLARQCYRSFLRLAQRLGDGNEQRFVRSKIARDFRVPVASSQEADFALALAETQLQNLRRRTAHYDALLAEDSFSPAALKAVKGTDTLAGRRRKT